jgi:hypothetical protein
MACLLALQPAATAHFMVMLGVQIPQKARVGSALAERLIHTRYILAIDNVARWDGLACGVEVKAANSADVVGLLRRQEIHKGQVASTAAHFIRF